MSESQMLVSICCITFNQEKFIKECLDGFIMQETNFEYEIIIHDDASTDDTAKIIKEYEKIYPNIIKPIYQKENQFSKGVSLSLTYNYPRAKGKYIALCEGDDYWTDSLKLQKQVDLMERNNNLIACHHWQTIAVEENGSYEERDSPKDGYYPKLISSVEAIFENKMRVKTRTVLFRNIVDANFFPEWYNKVAFGDVPLSFLLGKYGDFGFIDEKMAVYRQTEQGVSKAGLKDLGLKKFRVQHFKNWIEIWDYANKHYNYKYHKKSINTIAGFYKIIFANLPISLESFISVLQYNFFERRLSFFRTLPQTKIILLFYGKIFVNKIKRKLMFK